jgi:PAS domain S-box-containing protein
MQPDAPRARTSVSKFRRDFSLASMLPLVGFSLLVLLSGALARDHVAHLIADTTAELARDAEQSLQALGETVIRNKARDVARQIEVYVRAHPGRTIAELRTDPVFLDLAIQGVGETGYTAISEAADTYRILVHPNADLIDQDMRAFRDTMPAWWRIVEAGIGGDEAEGYYDWREPDGATRRKFLVATPVAVPVGGLTLMVSATTYIDEFSTPVAAMHDRAETIGEAYRAYVSRYWIAFGVVFALFVAATLTGTWVLGTRTRRRFIEPIGRLADAVRAFGEGARTAPDLAPVAQRADEIGTLARAFERMAAQIGELFDRLEQRVGELDEARVALQESQDHFRALYEASKQTEAIYRSLIHSSVDAIVMIDLDLCVTYVSPSFTRVFGWTEAELLGTRIPYVPRAERDRTLDILTNVVETGRPCQGYEARRRTKSGELVDVSISASRFDDHEGRPVGVLVILRDISETKRVEAHMQRVDRLEAIGTLAGGVAHDFNNLLMVVQGNVSILKAALPPDHPDYGCLLDIEAQIQSGASLTDQLLGYARKGRYEVEVADLNEVVKKTAETVRRTRKGIVFDYHLAADLLPVEADRHQIEQVLLNLCINACDAMPDGGAILFTTENVEKGDHPMVRLDVRDTGVGMDRSTMDHIFDPFFTTKELGRGTGLGLASAYGIVEGHGGSIEVASELGEGATFSVYLPATDAERPTATERAEQLAPGEGTVLIVDDEEQVLRVCARLVGRLGYRVLTAGTGAEAIACYEAEADAIDLVILDMIMPDMSGSAVFDRLKEIDPDASVLLCTGYSIDAKASELLARGCRGHIQKPYTPGELAVKVQAAIRRRGDAPEG